MFIIRSRVSTQENASNVPHIPCNKHSYACSARDEEEVHRREDTGEMKRVQDPDFHPVHELPNVDTYM